VADFHIVGFYGFIQKLGLNNYPSATDDVFNYAQELVKKNNIVLDIK